ncbi:Osmotin, thaumatin-like protein [Ceraceosorus guamensis]|uniref:Osmotin, thaumatin-like protein n=1 Tax=Ceraceosorus guamensis TaxID=1522189 RepID=A0A316VP14_9BASI|nr:Osmotin, thaumatin-like protein [Ceraceosorus guamensis]PWN39054.1 Osmotin, thaumatin-like protein [Ceraceosorus guamensis]
MSGIEIFTNTGIDTFTNTTLRSHPSFHNNCPYDVWPAGGRAPYGQPDNSVRYGYHLTPGTSNAWNIDDHQTGIRAWGRTGCDANGANCQTGACNGDTLCNDAGITSGVILSEYGYGSGDLIYWNLSRAGETDADPPLNVNIPLRVSGGGTTLDCNSNSDCAAAFQNPDDNQGKIHTAPLGTTYDVTFCP